MSVGAVDKQTGERIPTAGMPAVDAVLSGTSTNPVQNKVVKEALDGKQDTLTNADSFYGTCLTAENVAEKVVTLVDSDNFSLRPGVTVTVSFDNTNTAQNPTINVNGTGAKGVFYDTSAVTTTNLNKSGQANRPIQYTYNGTYWVFIGWAYDNASNYGVMSTEELTTGTATSQRVVRADYLKEGIEQLIYGKATDMVAADFNAGTSYTAGNYCIYEGKFYKFKNNHSGAWAAADVDEIKIAGELSALKSGLTSVEHDMVNKNSPEIYGLIRNAVLPSSNQQLINTEYDDATGRGVIYVGNPATIDSLALQTKNGSVTIDDLLRVINQIPSAPNNDGTYHLSVTVSGGTPSYSWVSG